MPLLPYVRLLARLLFATLAAWWCLFIAWSLFLLLETGPNAVLAWYRHIGSRVSPPAPDALMNFILQIAAALSITFGLAWWLYYRSGSHR